VLGWWILELTDSPLTLGVVFAYSRLPRWLGVICGVVSDRYDKRKILILCQLTNSVLCILMGILESRGIIQLLHITVIFVLTQVSFTFTMPARNTLISEMVSREELMSSLSLNAIVQSVTGILGASFGGVFYDRIGAGGCFYLMGVVYGVGVIPLFMMRLKLSIKTSEAAEGSVFKNLVEGLKYVGQNSPILALNVIAGVWNLLNVPATMTVMPVFSRNVLKLDATRYGLLMGGTTTGSLIASILLAFLGDFKHKGLLCIVSSIIAGGALFSLSLLRDFLTLFVLMVVVGATNVVMMTMIHTILLSYVPGEMRGRVMGVRMQVIVTLPLGTLMAGSLADTVGAPLTLGILGSSWVLFVLILSVLTPRLRKLT
jgi:MFS family permease